MDEVWMKSHSYRISVILVTVPFLVPCFLLGIEATSRNDQESETYSYAMPPKTGDGWDVASLSSQGIDKVVIGKLVNQVKDDELEEIHCILIARNGKLVLEEYFSGHRYDRQFTIFHRDSLHYVASVTKSVTSALIGIAVDRGMIDGVNQSLIEFFPEFTDDEMDKRKAQITLKHGLTMSGGLFWDEWTYPYTDNRNTHVQMNQSGDPIAYALALPVDTLPGKKFLYNSALAILLGGVLHNAALMPVDRFAEMFLFEPLDIDAYYWWAYPNGVFQTGGGLFLRPRDMAKIGQLYLQKGRWDDRQIISENWVSESVKMHMPFNDRRTVGYGYLWWLQYFKVGDNSVFSYSARGWGGQFIYVFPDLKMVVVLTGGRYTGPMPIRKILEEYILPAAL